MLATEPEAFDAVHFAAFRISTEISVMFDALPAGADLTQIADDLVADLKTMSDHPEFIAVFEQALVARQTLAELGVKI